MAPSRRSSNRNNNNNNEPPARPAVAAHVRERQRAVAEREASRLARPEARPKKALGHADRRKSAVSSTPSGVFHVTAAASSGEPQEWCGPFSVARQMIAKREQLKRQQEEEEQEGGEMHHPLDAAMEELETEKKRKAHPSMQWKGTASNRNKNNSNKNDSLYAKRQKRVQLLQQGQSSGSSNIPPLFDMCVRFVVDNFEHVESLGNLDTSIHTAIAHQLVAAGKLHGEFVKTLLAETSLEALELVDCSGITTEELSEGLAQLRQLRYLRLHQCGRCFHGPTVETVCSKNNTALFALSVGGAHLLKDQDAAKIVTACAPSALEFLACPQLSSEFAASLRDTYSNSSDNKLLELCLEDVPALKEEDLELLVGNTALSHLKSFSLRRVTGLTDAVGARMLQQCGATLQGLDVSENPQLTDAVLSAVRQYCCGNNGNATTSLHALALSALPQLTSGGLEALFMVIDNNDGDASPPPQLRTLDLSQLDRDAVTDEVLECALMAGSSSSGEQQQNSISSRSGGMVHLNVQGATRLTDAALEHLVRSNASHTLETLNVSFCPGLTDRGLGYLVDQCGRQLRQLHVWGNAQLTDVFLDGHQRANDPSLEIVGVWMKAAAAAAQSK